MLYCVCKRTGGKKASVSHFALRGRGRSVGSGWWLLLLSNINLLNRVQSGINSKNTRNMHGKAMALMF